MSLTRGNPPGCNVSSPDDYEYLINGAVSIGFTDGEFWDQSTINQGLGAATFSIQDNANKTQQVSIRLEDHPDIDDIGLNFCYEDSELGTLKAYTYKDKSIMSSLKILEEFGSNEANNSHVLYEYVSQIQTILQLLVGTTTLGSTFSKDDAKEAVFSNLNKLLGIISFDDDYDLVEDNFQLNGGSSFPATNTIRLKLDLTQFVPELDEPFTVVLNFNDTTNANCLFTINIENIKINEQYGNFSISLIDGYDKETNSIKENNLKIGDFSNLISDLQNDLYVDLRDLPILIQLGITTTKSMKYCIEGTLNLNIMGDFLGHFSSDLASRIYNVTVYVEILESQSIYKVNDVLCSIKINDQTSIPTSGLSTKSFTITSSEILIDKGDLYIKRYVKNYYLIFGCFYDKTEFSYLKTESNLFTENIAEWLLLFILNNQTIYDAADISNQEIKPLDIITYLTSNSENNNFEVGASMSPLDGKINIFYDPTNGYQLNKLTMLFDVKVLGLEAVTLSLDASLVHNVSASTLLEKRNDILNKINIFNNYEYTKNLGIADTPSSSNMYTVTVKNESTTNVISYNGYSW